MAKNKSYIGETVRKQYIGKSKIYNVYKLALKLETVNRTMGNN